MTRSTRQSKILEIINAREVETQEELVSELSRAGFETTQATISRDIKELGLIKALSENGAYRYVTIRGIDQTLSPKLINVFRETVISVVTANNLVVVKTLEGSSHAVSMIINQLNVTSLLGKVSGDDTLLLIAATNNDALKIKEKLDKLF